MNIVVALLIFTIVVVIHEIGHFLLAKKNGVEVTEFSVGMGPRLITFAKTPTGNKLKFLCSQKKFETEESWQGITKYSWKLLPIGGSCMMVGEDEDNESPNAFNNKGVWQRFAIIFAGPFFNFVLAFIFSIIILSNAGIDIPKVVQAPEGQPAAQAGIENGDIIKSINGHKITIGREIDTYVALHPLTGKNVKIVIERDGKNKTVSLNPNYSTYLFGFSYSSDEKASTVVSDVSDDSAFDKAGIKTGDVIVAIDGEKVSTGKDIEKVMQIKKSSAKSVTFLIKRDGEQKEYKVTPVLYKGKTFGMIASDSVKMGPLGVLKYSFVEVKYWIVTTVASLGQLVTGKLSTNDISGPVGIVNMVGSTVKESAAYGLKVVIINILYMTVLLSANLGVMNLLPLPALDGGRLVFILIEAVRGKPVDRTKEGYVHLAGFVLLMLLMIFVMYNDIVKIIK